MKFKSNIKIFLINYLFLIYLEMIFSLLMYSSYLRSTIFNIILYLIPISALITILITSFNNKTGKIISYVLYSILGIWFSLEFIFKKTFQSYFSLSLFKLTDQALQFKNETIGAILKNSYAIILFMIPLILLIIFRKKINYVVRKLKSYLIFIIIFIIGISLFILNINMQKNEQYSIYYLYNDVNDVSLNIEKLGVLDATFLDVCRSIFGFQEKLKEVVNIEQEENKDDVFDYGYNESDIDFKTLKSNDNEIKKINEYLSNINPTKKNKYTGIFEGKNLIYIVAESFSDIAVSKELTPTLYRLINSGFKFENFYTSNNLSTIGGEFQALTGLYANSEILPIWRSGKNSFPYGLATMFKNIGYNTYAYHNNSYTFQDRNKYLKALGFTNFKACRNGLEKLINCNRWPQSDVEMIEATVNDYINNEEPFLTYYVTVSGHFGYTFSSNSMSRKHQSEVSNLPYSEKVRGYIAANIELNNALEILLNKLEETGKLDDTVIVLLADHYPYDLSLSEINEVSSYEKDLVVEVNKSNLIIWNNKLKDIKITKTALSIDVIPTVYNLFGLDYDSRLFVGNDILSEKEGLAMFKNRSWVTDKGTYFSATNSYTKNELMTQEYVETINNVVSNRMEISKLIIKKNYYNYLFNR